MILNIYGESNTGKTQLIEKLIGELKEKGFCVGTVKNIKKEDFTIDTEGKDTWRHSKAGSRIVVANSKSEVAFLVNNGMTPKEVIKIIKNFAELDIIIVEGYWDDDSPKVAVGLIEERPGMVIRYKDDFSEILDYAVEGIEVEKVENKLPGLDCGKCGMETCKELAQSIRTNENTFDDCYYFSEKKISMVVDGKEIPLGKFVKEIVAGTIEGMVSSLKEVGEAKDIKIEIRG
jgi:molybdopterin-guanine dinucleotide biosynthesis protein B